MTTISIHTLAADELDAHADVLAGIMALTVNDGAAIGYMQPFSQADAHAFFTGQVFPEVRAGNRRLLVAKLNSEAVGTVQLIVALPPNQPHRCEVAKMMVHPAARRKGIGRALMQALDGEARAAGKTLVTLDTRTGDKAEPLYKASGFRTAGVIPGFALDPDGKAHHATTYMYKML
ncbi:GNAT family N-acetyltransferase [Hoeflea sp. AS60]|uniref:GNAT family N-acetyltransferase n=1 Tax=Hoeflea sp. AS60 TaxID=3135780 RepID=UPI0031748D2C